VVTGQTVTLDGTSSTGTAPLTCTWSFENSDGSIIWDTKPGCKIDMVFQIADMKYVRLIVTDANGATDDSLQSFPVTSPAPPAFVQVNSSTPQTAQTTVNTSYTSAERAGDLNVVVIGWSNSTGTISSVTDSAGNTYQVAAPVAHGSGISQAIYYAKNVKAGANTVTVRYGSSVSYADVRILEYSGIDGTSPFDATSSASGSTSTANSGSATTHFASELVVGAGTTTAGFTTAGSGFTRRILTSPDADIVEDKTVTATGSYNATAPVTGSWTMQMATFKAAGQ